MNVGILSDVHGDYAALEIALDRLDTYHQVDAHSLRGRSGRARATAR